MFVCNVSVEVHIEYGARNFMRVGLGIMQKKRESAINQAVFLIMSDLPISITLYNQHPITQFLPQQS